jgi:hypothetical protein
MGDNGSERKEGPFRPAGTGEKPDLEIRFTGLHWIEGQDDATDLCAHGFAHVRIGQEVVCDGLDTAVGSAALYLMRTLKQDHFRVGDAEALFPHCGHTMIAVDGGESVCVLNCFSGADWTVTHELDGTIVHVSEGGQEVRIDGESYRKLVFGLADQVEGFYGRSSPKTVPSDKSDREGYEAFWREWRRLRAEEDWVSPPSAGRWKGLFRRRSGKKRSR